MNRDQEHLRLLSIFHYVLAGFACLVPLFSLIYIGLGALALSGKMPSSTSAHTHSDVVSGWIFVCFGCALFVIGVAGVVLNFLAGRSLARRERRTLCLVVAALNCLHMPLGAPLGVFTFIVLGRPTVKLLFEKVVEGAGRPVGPGASPFSNPNP